jgi:hypothetical protein
LPDDRARPRTASWPLVLVTLLALALRAWPLHVPYINADQEFIPGMAVRAMAARSWRPESLVYPSGLFTVLRTAYGIAALGWPQGELVRAWSADTWPFVLVARGWSFLMGTVAVALTGVLGTSLLGPPWGTVAALLLAVSPVHVRESHWGSLDVPAAAFLVASLCALVRARRVETAGWGIAAGALAGSAMAFRWQSGTALLALPLVELTDDRRSMPARVGCLAADLLAAFAMFALLSPYAVLEPARVWRDLRVQGFVSFTAGGTPSLPVPEMLVLGLGLPACGIAVVGLAELLRLRPGTVAVGTLVVVPQLASMLVAERIFIRYTVPLLPFVALCAAAGVAAVHRRLPQRIATPIGVGLIVLLALDPLSRSVASIRLLGREDTRQLAGRWLLEHAPAGVTVLVPGVAWYSNPVLPAGRYQLRGYERDGSGFDPTKPGAAFLITAEHPGLPSQGVVPPAIAAWAERHARRVAEFRALAPGGTPGTFDPPDANYLPLRGFADALRPGPDVVIWRLPEPAEGDSPGER